VAEYADQDIAADVGALSDGSPGLKRVASAVVGGGVR
jgi:hypothetical protein